MAGLLSASPPWPSRPAFPSVLPIKEVSPLAAREEDRKASAAATALIMGSVAGVHAGLRSRSKRCGPARDPSVSSMQAATLQVARQTSLGAAPSLVLRLWEEVGLPQGNVEKERAWLEAFDANAVVEDLYYSDVSASDSAGVRAYVENKASCGRIVIDRLSDGTRSCGFTWHLEDDGAVGIRGTTYVELNEDGLVSYLREICEPLFKPGDATVELLKAIGGENTAKFDAVERRSPSGASDICRYLWSELQGNAAPSESLTFFAEEVLYEDFNYEMPMRGKAAVGEFLEKFAEIKALKFVAERFSDGIRACCFTWNVEISGASSDAPRTRGISFYELNNEGEIAYVRDIPESLAKPPPLQAIAAAIRPKLRVFQPRSTVVSGEAATSRCNCADAGGVVTLTAAASDASVGFVPAMSQEIEVRPLPPSSTGTLAFISERTLQLVAQIRQSGHLFVLISGARSSTVLERLPFLPAADAYVTENGGRIFVPAPSHSALTAAPIVEDLQWRGIHVAAPVVLESVPPSKRPGTLWDLFRKLEREGWTCDANKYSTDFRVSVKKSQGKTEADLRLVIDALPTSLACSFNLGSADFYPATSGKDKAAKYLMKALGQFDKDSTVSMGDDDNDLALAKVVGHTYIPGFTAESVRTAVQEEPQAFTVAKHGAFLGTHEVLELIGAFGASGSWQWKGCFGDTVGQRIHVGFCECVDGETVLVLHPDVPWIAETDLRQISDPGQMRDVDLSLKRCRPDVLKRLEEFGFSCVDALVSSVQDAAKVTFGHVVLDTAMLALYEEELFHGIAMHSNAALKSLEKLNSSGRHDQRASPTCNGSQRRLAIRNDVDFTRRKAPAQGSRHCHNSLNLGSKRSLVLAANVETEDQFIFQRHCPGRSGVDEAAVGADIDDLPRSQLQVERLRNVVDEAFMVQDSRGQRQLRDSSGKQALAQTACRCMMGRTYGCFWIYSRPEAPDLGGANTSPPQNCKGLEQSFALAQGVLLLGGTFVVRGAEVAYAWADRIPGDYPRHDPRHLLA
ncbi:unnamed protein product [Symbiodinium sp. CCMP2456]|nr:unnamed protein product [Symbiodinium sp. CCMP2456]